MPPGERREPSVCQPPSLSGHAQLHTWPITVLAHKGQGGGQAGLQGSGGKRKCHSSFCPASRYSSGMSVALITIPGSTRTQHRRCWEERVPAQPIAQAGPQSQVHSIKHKSKSPPSSRVFSPSGARHHPLQGTWEQPPQSHCSALHRNKSTAAPTRSPELHGHSHTASGPACSPHGSQHSYAETEQEMKLLFPLQAKQVMPDRNPSSGISPHTAPEATRLGISPRNAPETYGIIDYSLSFSRPEGKFGPLARAHRSCKRPSDLAAWKQAGTTQEYSLTHSAGTKETVPQP